MAIIPPSISRGFERFLKDLRTQETISAVAVFGSWSRYEASRSSDVDLLIVDDRDFDYEWYERIEVEGVMVDITRIPKKWIEKVVRPEVDQKLYEAFPLYDFDGTLLRAKKWVVKSYKSPGRVDIRTEKHLITSDTYLSRATSAFLARDYEATLIYTGAMAEPMGRILMEIAFIPMSESSFVWNLKRACEKLGMPETYVELLRLARLIDVDRAGVEEALTLFEESWNRITEFAERASSLTRRLHPKVAADIAYYYNQAFLKGLKARVEDMLRVRNYVDAMRYIRKAAVNVLENYGWLLSARRGLKFDYTSVLRILRGDVEQKSIYEKTVALFNVRDATRDEAEEALRKAKTLAGDIRRDRKLLIAKFVGKL